MTVSSHATFGAVSPPHGNASCTTTHLGTYGADSAGLSGYTAGWSRNSPSMTRAQAGEVAVPDVVGGLVERDAGFLVVAVEQAHRDRRRGGRPEREVDAV